MSPGLEERLNTGTEDNVIYVSNMVRIIVVAITFFISF
jgi:hypothetical protein